MSDQLKKITGASLPTSGSKSTASAPRVTFTGNTKEGSLDNSSSIAGDLPRCCAFKKNSPSQRCSKPAFPGTFFCSADHKDWDKKAAADSEAYKVYTGTGGFPVVDVDSDGSPDSSSSHSGKPMAPPTVALGALPGFAKAIPTRVDPSAPRPGRVATHEERLYSNSEKPWSETPDFVFQNIKTFLPKAALSDWFPCPRSPNFMALANKLTSKNFKGDLFGGAASTFSLASLLGPVHAMGKIPGVAQVDEILELPLYSQIC